MKLRHWDIFKDIDKGDDVLLQRLEADGVNLNKLEQVLEEHGDLLLFLFDASFIAKSRTSKFASLSKEMAYYEAQSVPTDVVRMLQSEFKWRKGSQEDKNASKVMKKRYS